jgi:phospholipid-binding lipoprotein MlaA
MLPFNCAPWLTRNTSIAVLAAGLAGCSSQPPSTDVSCADIAYSVNDPAEPFNRGVFAFNRVVDDYALAPVARGYRYSPDFFQTGVHNFVANFGEPKVFINDLLQGNPMRSANTLGRFVLNTTVGVVGLIDVSGMAGIPRHDADFGQTFGVWGIPQGPYLFIPVLGPSTVRDGTGLIVRAYASPLAYVVTDVPVRNILYGVGFVDARAQALQSESFVDQAALDRYTFIRRAYLQRRAYLVRDGKPAPADEDD